MKFPELERKTPAEFSGHWFRSCVNTVATIPALNKHCKNRWKESNLFWNALA